MKNTIKKATLSLGTVASIVAPIAAVVSCGDAEETKPYVAGQNRQVLVAVDGTDHSVTDKSFNQQGEEAAVEIAKRANFTKANAIKPASNNPEGFKGMYQSAPDGSVIVAPGFAHIDPLNASTDEIASKYVILVDGTVKKSNVASIEFKTQQAAFLAGYLAGEYLNAESATFGSDGLNVGAFGGLPFPSVTAFMIGFQKGIEWFNANKTDGQQDINFIDLGDKDDYFTKSFAAGQGKAKAQILLQKHADLILPVAGPQTLDVINEIIKVTGSTTQVIGVDTAQETLYTQTQAGHSIVAFSILKKIKKAIVDTLSVMEGTPVTGVQGLGHTTIGDLANGLVGVSQTGSTESLGSIYSAAKTTQAIEAAKALPDNAEFSY